MASYAVLGSGKLVFRSKCSLNRLNSPQGTYIDQTIFKNLICLDMCVCEITFEYVASKLPFCVHMRNVPSATTGKISLMSLGSTPRLIIAVGMERHYFARAANIRIHPRAVTNHTRVQVFTEKL